MKRKWFLMASGVVGLVVVLGLSVLFSGSHNRRPEQDDTNSGLQLKNASYQQQEASQVSVSAAKSENAALPWSRFRGPNGTGISTDQEIPTEWSDSKNLKWKTKLPGPGASSPILTEKHVFVTSYSGYGEQQRNAGDINQLKRHLLCIDRQDGKIVWTRTFDNEQREDPYQGMGLPEHGYATNSPVTDGQTVFAFFGKSGVIAFDLKGNELWKVSVGTSSGNRGWGSAASLTLYEDMLIVNAAEESQSLVALDKATGKEKWKSEASTLELCYSTPSIVHVDETRDELVIAVPGEVWGLNPLNGKLSWYVETSLTGNLSPSVIVDGKTVYAFGGYRSSGSLAIKVGGTDDVTDSHVLWTSRNSSYVATPVLLDGRFYWIDDRGVYYCSDAATGELVHRDRVPGMASGERPVYASPIAIDGKIYIQTRTSGLYVIEPSDELKIIAQNKFASDSSIFNATPAVDNGQLFLRSNEFLYCVGG
jgi:outer membrane protein assembly factor BamB